MEFSLPARMYLLAYDTGKGRLAGRGQLDLVVRAAALTSLSLDGSLADDGGRPKVSAAIAARPGASSTAPVLGDVLREIAESRPRAWHTWVGRNGRATLRAVAHQLEDARAIRLERYRVLGLFPATRVVLLQPGAVAHQRDAVRNALRSEVPASRVPPAEAAMAAMAAYGELRVALSRQEAKAHKQRIGELATIGGPAVAALRKAVRDRQAAAAAG